MCGTLYTFADMTDILTPGLIQIASSFIIAAVLVQVAVMMVSSLTRLVHERVQQKLSLDLLGNQVDLAKGRLAEVEKIESSWPGFRKFKVQQKVQESADVCSFYLSPHDGKPLPFFKPGQYLTFDLNEKGIARDADKNVVRCYSLSDSPGHNYYYRITVKRVPPPRDRPDLPPGMASSYFHDKVEEGSILDVKAPAGNFFLDQTVQAPVVLIGGGIGITPVLSMLNTIASSGSKRETWFFLGVRNRKDHIFKEHLEKIALEYKNIHVRVCYSDPEEDDVEGRDYHHAERVSVDLFKRVLPSSNYDYYICGPGPMMTSLTEGLTVWSVPKEKVHFEAFGPASVKKPRSAAGLPSDEKTEKIELEFAKNDKTFTWDPSIGSLLDFALENGIMINSGCRAGNCGTCLTAILSGEVTYIQEPGSMPEEGSCLTCVSVPKGDLTLDA